MDDSRIGRIVGELRRELGMDQPPPPPRRSFPIVDKLVDQIVEGIARAFSWISNGGWRILVPIVVALLGLLIYLLLRKIPIRQKLSEAERVSPDSGDAVPELPADLWLHQAETAAECGDFSRGVVCLYRAGLFRCLQRLDSDQQMTNREIRRKIPAGWQAPFESLYLAAEPVLFDGVIAPKEQYQRLTVLYREGFQ